MTTTGNRGDSNRSLTQTLPLYLSLEQAAAVMSVSVKTLRRRIADGTIPAYRCGTGPFRIQLDDLEAAFRRVPCGRITPSANDF